MIHAFAVVAVHAEHLEAWREFVVPQPSVGRVPRTMSAAEAPPSPVRPVVVDVIETEKREFSFTAAGTYQPAVCVEDFDSNSFSTGSKIGIPGGAVKFSVPFGPFSVADFTLCLPAIKPRQFGFLFLTSPATLQVLVRYCHG